MQRWTDKENVDIIHPKLDNKNQNFPRGGGWDGRNGKPLEVNDDCKMMEANDYCSNGQHRIKMSNCRQLDRIMACG